MNDRIACLLLGAALTTAVSACTRSNPAQPTPATTTVTTDAALTASVGAPRPLQPANNAQIRNLDQPVTLVALNGSVTKPGPVTDTFEVASDAAFSNKIQTKDGVAEGSGGQTSVKLDGLPAGNDYFWHVRATGGGTVGVFGAVSKFTIGPAIIINAPAAVRPLTGAQTDDRPTFTIANSVRQGPAGPITYKIEIAKNSSFSPVLITATVSEVLGQPQTSFTPAAGLPAQTTLFWRATAFDLTNGISTAPSATQSFATALAIDLAKVVYLKGPDLSTWRETGRIIVIEQDGNAAIGGPMCISFTDPGWPDAKWIYGGSDPNFGVYGNQWYFANIGGTWYGGPGEWLYRGAASCKAGQGTNTIGPDSGFGAPFSSWSPKPGELVGYAVSASARALPQMSTVQERTNVVVQPWHDSSLQAASLARALSLSKK